MDLRNHSNQGNLSVDLLLELMHDIEPKHLQFAREHKCKIILNEIVEHGQIYSIVPQWEDVTSRTVIMHPKTREDVQKYIDPELKMPETELAAFLAWYAEKEKK